MNSKWKLPPSVFLKVDVSKGELTREQLLDNIQKEHSCSRDKAEEILYEEERWEASF